ncbi:hypothetical protein [Leeuwenhoekiella marinoflava]|uniref:Lipoprotein n=2 Tax=Leeuwenhoekiella marinoflava TaxID=988 RepID=A0A4Q0PNT8_9FLAO|nr:hypothetical protein [Leeuwenhoekiella marinoflava]RXG30686.1 hypothetical protein DSL99_1728 [Leeuwenhoekiella marinoflava]SHF19668.1 hypothetical protein SAMN02745246_01929 [Leeuwenhoekiella marinoflava DSM 3653]
MKINISILSILFCIVLTSCGSDKLTNSKAESIIEDCQTNESLVKTKKFTYGTVEMDDMLKSKFPDFLKPYQKLEERGIVKIGSLERVEGGIMGKKDSYEITLTPKAEKFLVDSEVESSGKIRGKLKICEYKFDSVIEIQEIPERNDAKVKVSFARFNETPFFEDADENKNPKKIVETVTFRKTNEGWKLCDQKG